MPLCLVENNIKQILCIFILSYRFYYSKLLQGIVKWQLCIEPWPRAGYIAVKQRMKPMAAPTMGTKSTLFLNCFISVVLKRLFVTPSGVMEQFCGITTVRGGWCQLPAFWKLWLFYPDANFISHWRIFTDGFGGFHSSFLLVILIIERSRS